MVEQAREGLAGSAAQRQALRLTGAGSAAPRNRASVARWFFVAAAVAAGVASIAVVTGGWGPAYQVIALLPVGMWLAAALTRFPVNVIAAAVAIPLSLVGGTRLLLDVPGVLIGIVGIVLAVQERPRPVASEPAGSPRPVAWSGAGAAMPAVRTNGLAIASFVLSLIGLLALGGLTSIVGVVLGHVARRQIARANGAETGSGLAMAGLVLGYVGIVMMLALIGLVVWVLVS